MFVHIPDMLRLFWHTPAELMLPNQDRDIFVETASIEHVEWRFPVSVISISTIAVVTRYKAYSTAKLNSRYTAFYTSNRTNPF